MMAAEQVASRPQPEAAVLRRDSMQALALAVWQPWAERPVSIQALARAVGRHWAERPIVMQARAQADQVARPASSQPAGPQPALQAVAAGLTEAWLGRAASVQPAA
jgi:hypothetical protein